MRVRMRVQIVGTRNGVAWPPPGETTELPDDEGARMCSRGFCEPVAETRVETAVPDAPVETRTPKKRAAPKRR